MSENRLTPERVRAAFEQTRATPAQGLMFGLFRDGRQCCGLGACHLAAGGPIPPTHFGQDDEISAQLGIDRIYLIGFQTGWDGRPPTRWHRVFNRVVHGLYNLGHADGVAAWAACQDLIPTEGGAA